MSHNHSHCIGKALETAEQLCDEKSLRFTPIRRRVLELVWESHEAIKAYDVLEKLQEEDSSAKPPTAYRALDFLLEHGLIHRIESLNAYIGCPNPEEHHSFQLLICNSCGLVKEIEQPGLAEELDRYAGAQNFQPETQIIEVRGLCQNCAKQQN